MATLVRDAQTLTAASSRVAGGRDSYLVRSAAVPDGVGPRTQDR
jgi:hypothetical protein